ncbi:hypothetical protein ACIGHN_03050 [Acidovorax sp. NPDC077693]|uniref:hypothetical protein n=1 Tax=unclassified Acidovorax TaxID=2684926 RepID=UPI0037CC5F7B
MDRHPQFTLATLASGVSAVIPVWAQFARMAAERDCQNRIAPPRNPYTVHLSKLKSGLCAISHEIGHIKKGRSKSRIQAAPCTSTPRKAVSADISIIGKLANSRLCGLFEKMVRA